jgi:hypothetical protein
MGFRIPETVYDAGATYSWQNANDRVSYQRAFNEGGGEQKRIAQAFLSANPDTPNIEIQVNMNQPNLPNRFGYDTTPPTIESVLGNELDPNNVDRRAWNDFSGTDSSYSGTDLPSLPIW